MIFFREHKTALSSLIITLILCASDRLNAQDLGNLKQEKWMRFHGNMNTGFNLYGVNGIAARRVPFSAFANGSATLSLKGVALPFSFQVMTPLNDRNNVIARQPFNQFGVSPTWKKTRLYLGWRNMNWSRYTLDGHVFLGAGVEVNPGRLRLGAMYGRFTKAVQEDSARQAFNRISQYPFAAYNRWGYGLKVGWGRSDRFVDLIYFKAKDDPASARNTYSYQLAAPGENAVLGLKTRFGFLKNFTFEADAAISAYTRDVRSDSVVLEQKYTRYTNLIMTPKLSTQAYYAGDAAVTYRLKTFSAALRFQRIMPDYRSFGAYYMQTDVQRITIAPNWYHKSGKLQVNASLGTENDNLANKKRAETTRSIGSLTLGFRPGKNWGGSLQLSNYGSAQRAVQKSVSDTQLLNQVTRSIMLSPYYIITGKTANHTLMYMFTSQNLNDRNRINSTGFTMHMVNHTLSYGFSGLKNGLRGDASAFVVNTSIPQDTMVLDARNTGFSAGLGKTYKKVFTTGFNATFSTNSVNGESDGSTVMLRFSNSWRIHRQHALNANFTLTRNESKTQLVARKFTEYLATITYNYSF